MCDLITQVAIISMHDNISNMSTLLEILEESQSSFLQKKNNNEKLQEILTKLDQNNQSIAYAPHRPLTLSIKTSVLKQKNSH